MTTTMTTTRKGSRMQYVHLVPGDGRLSEPWFLWNSVASVASEVTFASYSATIFDGGDSRCDKKVGKKISVVRSNLQQQTAPTNRSNGFEGLWLFRDWKRVSLSNPTSKYFFEIQPNKPTQQQPNEPSQQEREQHTTSRRRGQGCYCEWRWWSW